MSSSPASAPDPNQNQEQAKQILARLLGYIAAIPAWVRTPFKSVYLVSTATFRLIAYMVLHWLVERFFTRYIALDYPLVTRFLNVLSVGVFGFLIVKSSLELVWAEIPRRKKSEAKEGTMEK